ncbi:putative tRNA(5-methylaminomethyl-2- thiouridylate) methyltransferase [Candidatus Carsonella ruddii HT isolate Thao2000]|uniref:Putative tRNA(5-methylaminomethyl-2-thiouridylate) methyltransferase n=1 Tax=Candidatus Carsonella ruddii HT isolate Thao2000 TaxID=1202539 RepID=J3TEE7_CARRU|nr:tRNA (5-methylaminomethyl-2-thiouridylate)-methyltransferase [Candidatus Carsonella ruddii]AFP84082.1 putative tRNA(5-methylaminomethyl-2- thiouridylate) methyltransferase [Candidatus Carsonella ruddii HT isolate Thao2000]
MINILLNSGGKDSNFFNSFFYCFNLFIKINNCYLNFEQKYCFFNNKYLKKKIFLMTLNYEYCFIFNKYITYNIDFYCNKLIKIYLVKILFNKKILFTGHYFRKKKNFFFLSIDQKKDQNFFLNYKNNIFSINGYFNKNKIYFYSIKNNFFCAKKKSTTGICFKKNINFLYYYIFFENKMLLNILFLKKINLGKNLFNYKIIKIKKKIIVISCYKLKFLIVEINIKINISNIYYKINSQNIKNIGKIIKFKKKFFLLFYKKKIFLEKKNILLFYNDLIINNIKIKKKN